MVDDPPRAKKNILLVVEGKQREPRLLGRALKIFGLEHEHRIVPLGINIHGFIEKHLAAYDDAYEDIDLIGVLREAYPEFAKTLSQRFTDILLVFDFDPQDNRYDKERLTALQQAFCNSTDPGKLFINYPAVESYRDFAAIGDAEFLDSESSNISYKELVGRRTNRLDDIERIEPFDYVRLLAMHVSKIQHLTMGLQTVQTAYWMPDPNLAEAGADAAETLDELLDLEIEKYEGNQMLYPCCTCLLFVCDWPEHVNGLWRKAC